MLRDFQTAVIKHREVLRLLSVTFMSKVNWILSAHKVSTVMSTDSWSPDHHNRKTHTSTSDILNRFGVILFYCNASYVIRLPFQVASKVTLLLKYTSYI